ncbi:hypothetical protein THAOC_03266 [Thalassiosira oceanica]|uniref:MYND-type domain-containing protein n=1 Tax=Thalassiosira oceanica TaxID=159749 RepID=K0TBZ7_THAOC|nr:hypothetical protein THAOC_03266 [Thalassiosira oceanica]|eukprot:EJK75025.1 hypothetical protein THAOC_03266 [Thalassiosira oceanica]
MSCIAVDGGVPADVCANCGKGSSGGEGGVKLKDCTACRLVKYCGVDCQRAHRRQHKKSCKRRAAELKDEQLYGQGHERREGDFCPICTLPIPLPMHEHSVFEVCCMKRICEGCAWAVQKRGMHDCAFCRTPTPDNNADSLALVQARDARKVVELWTEAAELGSVDALLNLGVAYDRGEGVEGVQMVQKDMAKAVQFYEKAAMQGCPLSRHKLGCIEGQKGNHDRAAKHFLISAKMGYKDSVETVKEMFMAGVATKEQYAEALKGYRDAVEEMKSHDRDQASALRKS